jgi:hypothetical protein
VAHSIPHSNDQLGRSVAIDASIPANSQTGDLFYTLGAVYVYDLSGSLFADGFLHRWG